MKIRGFKGYDKQTGSFVRIHNDTLLQPALTKFLMTGGTMEPINEYLIACREEISSLRENDTKIEFFQRFASKSGTLDI